jgi:hypothetical protein
MLVTLSILSLSHMRARTHTHTQCISTQYCHLKSMQDSHGVLVKGKMLHSTMMGHDHTSFMITGHIMFILFNTWNSNMDKYTQSVQ